MASKKAFVTNKSVQAKFKRAIESNHSTPEGSVAFDINKSLAYISGQ